jgi:hypothetical protein
VVAYTAMWEDAAEAGRTSDPEHPRLDDHASGDALALLKFVIQGHAEKGQVSRGAPRHDVTVVESTDNRRQLRDCLDETDWLLYDARDGELVDNKPGSHRWTEATVERRGSTWIVTELTLGAAATC